MLKEKYVEDFPKILVQMFKDSKDIDFVRNTNTWTSCWLEKHNYYSFAIGVVLKGSEEEYLSSVEILIEDFNKQSLSKDEVLENITKAFWEYQNG